MNELAERVSDALHQMARATMLAAPPVTAVIAAAQRRRRRHLAIVASAVVVAMLAALSVGLKVRHDRSQPAVSPAAVLERAALNSGLLVPASLPEGLTAGLLDAHGPDVRVSTDDRELVLASRDGRHAVIVTRTIVPAAAFEQQLAEGYGTRTDVGANPASYAVLANGMVALTWAADDRLMSLNGFGITLRAARDLGATVRFDGVALTAAVPDGLDVVFRGPGAEGPWLSFRWDSVNRSLQTEARTTTPGFPLFLQFGSSVQYVEVRGRAAGATGSGTSWTLAWEEPAGVEQTLTVTGFTLAEAIGIADGLVTLDRDRWRRLLPTFGPGSIQDNVESVDRPSGPPANQLPTATTAVGAVQSQAEQRDLGPADAVPSRGDVAVKNWSIPGDAIIVHTENDGWIGLSLFVWANQVQQCTATPNRDTDDKITGFTDTCTGARYSADGDCLDQRCYVGLTHFAVRVDNGRILAELGPQALRPGAPRNDLLG